MYKEVVRKVFAMWSSWNEMVWLSTDILYTIVVLAGKLLWNITELTDDEVFTDWS